MATARAVKQALLHAIMFAPEPSFPGAEFGLAAPVILPQTECGAANHCRSLNRGDNSNKPYDPAAAFGGSIVAPTRDSVPSGLACLLEAAEIAQSSQSTPLQAHSNGARHLAHMGFAPSAALASSAVHSSVRSASAPDGSSGAVGAPDFVAFLRESGSLLTLPSSNLTSQSAVLQQLVLLQHWIPILDRMAPVHKNMLWETCKMYPGFRLTNPKLTSYRKVISAWGANIAAYVANVTALFAAIGYLKHHDILKNDFCFPDSALPVFRTFVTCGLPQQQQQQQQVPVSAPVRNGPITTTGKRRPSVSKSPPVVCIGASTSLPSPPPLSLDDNNVDHGSSSSRSSSSRDLAPATDEAPAVLPPQAKRARVMSIAALTAPTTAMPATDGTSNVITTTTTLEH